jgi:hypothetical protein
MADALQRYNLVGPGAREANLALMPFASLLRMGQSRPISDRLYLVRNSITSTFINARTIIKNMVETLRSMNDEKDRQRLILNRIERLEIENRLEAGEPQREIEETIERPAEIDNTLGSILARILGFITNTAVSIARAASELVRTLTTFTRRLTIRAIPGVALLATAAGAYRALTAMTEGRTALEGYQEGRETIYQSFSNWLFGRETPVYNGPIGVRGDERIAMQYFMSQGWTQAQAAGIVGNLIQESNLNPASHNLRENAQGIAQWTPRGRRQQIVEQYLGRPILTTTFEEQLGAIQWELTTVESNAGNRLRLATTPEDAAQIVDQFYERSAGTERSIRINHARRLFNSIQTSSDPTRSSTPNESRSSEPGQTTTQQNSPTAPAPTQPAQGTPTPGTPTPQQNTSPSETPPRQQQGATPPAQGTPTPESPAPQQELPNPPPEPNNPPRQTSQSPTTPQRQNAGLPEPIQTSSSVRREEMNRILASARTFSGPVRTEILPVFVIETNVIV